MVLKKLVVSLKMASIVTRNMPIREDWLQQLADVITDPDELLRILFLNEHPHLQQGSGARRLFPYAYPALLLPVCNLGMHQTLYYFRC